MTRDEVTDVVAGWQQALARHDLDAVGQYYAEHAEVDSPLGGSVVGREAVRSVFEAFFLAFPNASFDFEPPLVDDNRVAMTATISGSQLGPFMGLPASGRAFRFTIVCLFDIADGLIARERRVYDFTSLLIQLGTLKARPA